MKIRQLKVIFRKAVAVVVACGLAYSMMSMAQIYKWTDADGTTHYTQTPPSNDIETTEIKPPPSVDTESARKELRLRKKKLEKSREQRLKQEGDKQKAEEERALAKKNCEQARARLATYEKPRVNLVDGDGNYTKITEEKRIAELAKSRELVKEHCD